MNWNNCFSSARFGIEGTSKGVRTEYERDWDRIIFSSPFRRLQNKTQVFPLPEEVFVHNRLTHSLEVASVGRSLGRLAGQYLAELPEVKADKEAEGFYSNNLNNVIAAACLAHDLGNPAFGHSGEEAISKYFIKRNTDKEEDRAFRSLFSPEEWSDLTRFEGNANALRILTMQQNGRVKGGFRLTYSTLGAIIKYPCESMASQGKKGEKHRKKYGYFTIDKDIFLDIAKELNMIREPVADRVVFKRHPFVYLVEAADDICYNIIDFEDAHRLEILSFDETADLFLEIVRRTRNSDEIKRIEKQMMELSPDKNEAIAYLRANAINILALKCAEVFNNNQQKIISGTYNSTLIEDIYELQDVLKKIEEISIKKIYNFKKVIKLELSGFRIMSGLVEDFVTAALTPIDKRETEHKKILELLPSQYMFVENSSPYVKVMHVIDFISGMTDLFALKLYRNLRGIEL